MTKLTTCSSYTYVILPSTGGILDNSTLVTVGKFPATYRYKSTILEEDDRFKLSISYELSQYHSPDVAVYSANTVFCLDTNAYTIMVSLYLICISGMYIARNLTITFYDDEGGSKILRYCLLQ